MKNEKVKKILFWSCIAICLGGVSYIGYDYLNREKTNDVYKKVQKEVEKQKEESEDEEEKPADVIPIDFAALKETNADIYAWIDIPDTNIHYPIVQSPTDDSYYLNHTIEGVEGYPGSIYTERLNAKDFSDFNTVIYGHDMKDGTMFKDLHKYEDAEFFSQHDEIVIYTETEKKVYKVFAAIVYDDRHILYHYDNQDVEDRKAFLQSLYESRNMKNQIRSDVSVDENSHIITLSTCIGGQPENRFLVGAVEIDE